MAQHRVHMFYIGLYREKHENIFLSETIRPRALIFGMKHHLVDLPSLFKLCLAPPRGSHVLHRLI